MARRIRPGREAGPVTRLADGASGAKSPLMMMVLFLLWMLMLAAYGPALWRVVTTARTALEAVVLVAFSGMLVLFWLLAAYYAAVVVLSAFARPAAEAVAPQDAEWPPVAVLYPTCDDFQEPAALSCVSQDYPCFHVFLLDDSSSEAGRAEVDAFQAAHPDRTTVVRRANRDGYKAGNLNHALRGAAAGYPFFSVIDADEQMPRDFLRRTVPHLAGSRLAFVQANHAPNAEQKTPFARDLAETILPFWHVHCRPRNRYGFVPYVGHGALLRRCAWEEVGGFPEVVTEDLAFSAELAARGRRGVYREDVICREDFPATYRSFKDQYERYVVGVTQVVRSRLLRVLRSRRVTLTEKIDFCLWWLPLYVPALCLLFAFVCCVGLGVVLGQYRHLNLLLAGHHFTLGTARALDARFTPLWTWHFQIVSVLCAFSPTFAALFLGARRRLQAGRLLLWSTLPYLSLMLISWRGLVLNLAFGRAEFTPTGRRYAERPGRVPAAPTASGGRRLLHALGSLAAWEVLVGASLAALSLVCLNMGLLAVCCALGLAPALASRDWNSRGIRTAACLCFLLVLLHVCISTALASNSFGLSPLIFSVHF